MKFNFEAYAVFDAADLNHACRQLSEQFARMAEENWHSKDPTRDGVFKNGHVELNAVLSGLDHLTEDEQT